MSDPADKNSQRPLDEENIELEEETSEEAAFAQIDLRLEDFAVRYFEQAERLQLEINGTDTVAVINRSLEHLAGRVHAGPLEQTPKGYFLDGMYEDLVSFADSFSEAADAMNMTKGAISYQMKQLEADLGFVAEGWSSSMPRPPSSSRKTRAGG